MEPRSTYNNRMRNLHQFVREEYGRNVLREVHEWKSNSILLESYGTWISFLHFFLEIISEFVAFLPQFIN